MPSIALDMIRLFTLPLVVVYVLALLVIRSGMDLLILFSVPIGVLDTASWQVAVDASIEGWLDILGVGLSLTLFFIFVPPYYRLLPYVRAERALEEGSASSEEVRARHGILGHARLDAMDRFRFAIYPEKERLPEKPPNADREPFLARHIGANRRKFRIILGARGRGGAFHALVGGEALQTSLQWLGVLTPALLGPLLAKLG